MKKILNDAANYVDEMLAGLVAAHPEHYQLYGDTVKVVPRATARKAGNVGLVPGGVSGHSLVFSGHLSPCLPAD